MPSKINVRGRPSKPKETAVVTPENIFHCCKCYRSYKSQKAHFQQSPSPLYAGNNSFLPICDFCLDELYNHYRLVLGEKEALYRVCQKFDIYWADEAYDAMRESPPTTKSRIRAYITKVNNVKYQSKTFDDHLDEIAVATAERNATDEQIRTEFQAMREELDRYRIQEAQREEAYLGSGGEEKSKEELELINFWGPGYEPLVYRDLQNRFLRWTTGENACECVDPAQESLLKQIKYLAKFPLMADVLFI